MLILLFRVCFVVCLNFVIVTVTPGGGGQNVNIGVMNVGGAGNTGVGSE